MINNYFRKSKTNIKLFKYGSTEVENYLKEVDEKILLAVQNIAKEKRSSASEKLLKMRHSDSNLLQIIRLSFLTLRKQYWDTWMSLLESLDKRHFADVLKYSTARRLI